MALRNSVLLLPLSHVPNPWKVHPYYSSWHFHIPKCSKATKPAVLIVSSAVPPEASQFTLGQGNRSTSPGVPDRVGGSAAFREDDGPWGGVFQDWWSQAWGLWEENHLPGSRIHSTDACVFCGHQTLLVLEKLIVQVWFRAGRIWETNFILLTPPWKLKNRSFWRRSLELWAHLRSAPGGSGREGWERRGLFTHHPTPPFNHSSSARICLMYLDSHQLLLG